MKCRMKESVRKKIKKRKKTQRIVFAAAAVADVIRFVDNGRCKYYISLPERKGKKELRRSKKPKSERRKGER